MKLPARDSSASSELVDLSAYYNASLDLDSLERQIPPLGFLTQLPRGVQKLPESKGVPFDVRGVVQLNSKDQFPGVPDSVSDMQVKRRCRRLNFLHATHFKEPDNTEIGVYVVHYAAGKQDGIPIVYGKDLLDWYFTKNDPTNVYSANLAWTGSNTVPNGMRVFSQVWENPFPELEIRSIDFVSKLTKCAPFLIAITAE